MSSILLNEARGLKDGMSLAFNGGEGRSRKLGGGNGLISGEVLAAAGCSPRRSLFVGSRLLGPVGRARDAMTGSVGG